MATSDITIEKVREALPKLMEAFTSLKNAYGLEGLNFALVPLPESICEQCAAQSITSLLALLAKKEQFFIVTGKEPHLTDFFETFKENLINKEHYEMVEPLEHLHEEVKRSADSSHFMGVLPIL